MPSTRHTVYKWYSGSGAGSTKEEDKAAAPKAPMSSLGCDEERNRKKILCSPDVGTFEKSMTDRKDRVAKEEEWSFKKVGSCLMKE
jgi:hypothetical protein